MNDRRCMKCGAEIPLNTSEMAEVQKYEICNTCTHWGTVFSYKRISHEMMCGFGSKHCEEPMFGKQHPSGYLKRK